MTNESKPKGTLRPLHPAEAWTGILAFIVFSSFCILIGASSLLNLAFPLGAVGVGILLHLRAPVLYVSFCWWLWFLAPLVRRLAEYRSQWIEPNPILLTPYLVTLVTLIALWNQIPQAQRQGSLPFVLAGIGLVYSFCIGLIQRPILVVAIALLQWLTPVLFGYYLFIHWRNYPDFRQSIQRTFVWGVLIMGAYGILQYLVAPQWDRLWLIAVEINSQGTPEPLGLRVWSTMNSSEPFAAYMAAGLLLLLTYSGGLRLPAAIVGYLSFLLTLVRSAWIGWLAGLLTLAGSLKSRRQIGLIITISLMAVCVIPLIRTEPFATAINSRLETISNLQNDGSANIRRATFNENIASALLSVLGHGMGGPSHDSSILLILFDLGWLGTGFYLGGMLLLVLIVFQGDRSYSDPFLSAVRAVIISALIRFPVNVPMHGVNGILLWGFLGIGLAASKYHQHQSKIRLQQDYSTRYLAPHN